MTIWLIRQAMYPLFPRTQRLPGLADTDLGRFLRQLRSEAEPMFWLGLVLGAFVFCASPILTTGIPLPSFWLPARLRERHAARVVAHRIYALRQAVAVVRLCAGMCWGADPQVRARFGLAPYPPDPGTLREA